MECKTTLHLQRPAPIETMKDLAEAASVRDYRHTHTCTHTPPAHEQSWPLRRQQTHPFHPHTRPVDEAKELIVDQTKCGINARRFFGLEFYIGTAQFPIVI